MSLKDYFRRKVTTPVAEFLLRRLSGHTARVLAERDSFRAGFAGMVGAEEFIVREARVCRTLLAAVVLKAGMGEPVVLDRAFTESTAELPELLMQLTADGDLVLGFAGEGDGPADPAPPPGAGDEGGGPSEGGPAEGGCGDPDCDCKDFGPDGYSQALNNGGREL